jgi:hypothetical protein
MVDSWLMTDLMVEMLITPLVGWYSRVWVMKLVDGFSASLSARVWVQESVMSSVVLLAYYKRLAEMREQLADLLEVMMGSLWALPMDAASCFLSWVPMSGYLIPLAPMWEISLAPMWEISLAPMWETPLAPMSG